MFISQRELKMKVCGVELKGNDANICLLSMSEGLFDLPDCRVRRVTLENINSQGSLISFQFAFAKLVEDYKIDKVIIRQRNMKGKFSGGAVGFKLEAAIQLIENLDVEILSPVDVKEKLKLNPVQISFAETGLKAFQEPAFTTAYAVLMSQP